MFFRFAVMGLGGSSGFESDLLGSCEDENNKTYLKFEQDQIILDNVKAALPEIGEELFVFKTRIFNNQLIHSFSIYRGVISPPPLDSAGRPGYYGASIILSIPATAGLIISGLTDLANEVERLFVKDNQLTDSIAKFQSKEPPSLLSINELFKEKGKTTPITNSSFLNLNDKKGFFVLFDERNFIESIITFGASLFAHKLKLAIEIGTKPSSLAGSPNHSINVLKAATIKPKCDWK